MSRLKTDAKGRRVDEKGRTFLERYVGRKKFADPEFVEAEKNKQRKLYTARLMLTDDDEIEVLGDDDADHSREIQARKASRKLDRRAFAAELAKLVDDWKPELVHAGLDKSIVKEIDDAFLDFWKRIDAVPEDDLPNAIETLSDLYYEMQETTEALKARLLAYTGVDEAAEGSDDAPVVLWSMDLGRDLIKKLGQRYKFLRIESGVVSVSVPKAIHDAFEEEGDLMTPAQIQHEASTIAHAMLDQATWLVDLVHDKDVELVNIVAASRAKGELQFADDAAAVDWMNLQLEKLIEQQINPEVAELAELISQKVENIARYHAERAAAIREHLHHRKRRIARRAVAPVIGLVAGGLGIVLGTGLIVLAPATGGISAVGGAGIALASVAALRASVSGIRLIVAETRSLAKLTKSLERDANKLIESYEKGKVPGKEIAAATLNSILVATVVKSFPRLKEKFDLIERRMAKVSAKQIELASDLNDLLDRVQEDVAMMRKVGIDEVTIEHVESALEEQVNKLIEDIIAVGEKIQVGEGGKSFVTIFATAKGLLKQISSMIGSKTAKATAIIPVVTEFAFLIANASVGCAGLFEATTVLQVAVNGAVVIGGEIGDGIGTVQSV